MLVQIQNLSECDWTEEVGGGGERQGRPGGGGGWKGGRGVRS